MISDIRRVLGNFTLPLQLNDLVEVLDLDITTGDEYHIWYYLLIKNLILGQPQNWIFNTQKWTYMYVVCFRLVCDFNATGYQCKCEDQYFWPCDMCTKHGSCSDTNDTCSCVSSLIDGQFCQPISEMTGTIKKIYNFLCNYTVILRKYPEDLFVFSNLFSSISKKTSDVCNHQQVCEKCCWSRW